MDESALASFIPVDFLFDSFGSIREVAQAILEIPDDGSELEGTRTLTTGAIHELEDRARNPKPFSLRDQKKIIKLPAQQEQQEQQVQLALQVSPPPALPQQLPATTSGRDSRAPAASGPTTRGTTSNNQAAMRKPEY